MRSRRKVVAFVFAALGSVGAACALFPDAEVLEPDLAALEAGAASDAAPDSAPPTDARVPVEDGEAPVVDDAGFCKDAAVCMTFDDCSERVSTRSNGGLTNVSDASAASPPCSFRARTPKAENLAAAALIKVPPLDFDPDTQNVRASFAFFLSVLDDGGNIQREAGTASSWATLFRFEFAHGTEVGLTTSFAVDWPRVVMANANGTSFLGFEEHQTGTLPVLSFGVWRRATVHVQWTGLKGKYYPTVKMTVDSPPIVLESVMSTELFGRPNVIASSFGVVYSYAKNYGHDVRIDDVRIDLVPK